MPPAERVMAERIADGFPGERMVILPPAVVDHFLGVKLVNDLMPVWCGHFPKAAHHFIDRPAGHEYHLLIYCVGGRGWVQHEGRKLRVESGDVVILPAGIPHGYFADPSQPWSIYWFHLTGQRVPDYLQLLEAKGQVAIRHLGIERTIVQRFEELITAAAGDTTVANMLDRMTLAARILILCHRLLKPNTRSASKQPLTEVAIGFMQERLTSPLQLPDLLAHCRVSQAQLNRSFRRDTGFSPMRYFTQLRMREASQLLVFTDAPVADVGSRVGYVDPYHFSRVFKRVYGVSPTAYRQGHPYHLD